MDISIDRNSPLPIHEQMIGQIRLLVDSGRLQPGDPLPTIKTMALEVGVNVNTVAGAYKALEEEGYLSQRKRAGTAVAESPPRRTTAILLERVAAEAAARARAAGLDSSELVRAVAAHGALAIANPRPRVAVIAATELEAASLAARAEAILGEEVECRALTPQSYDSLDYHLTLIDPQLTERLHPRPSPANELPMPTHLKYGPEFPAAAD